MFNKINSKYTLYKGLSNNKYVEIILFNIRFVHQISHLYLHHFSSAQGSSYYILCDYYDFFMIH